MQHFRHSIGCLVRSVSKTSLPVRFASRSAAADLEDEGDDEHNLDKQYSPRQYGYSNRRPDNSEVNRMEERRTIPTLGAREQFRQDVLRRHRGPSLNRVELLGTVVKQPLMITHNGNECVSFNVQTNQKQIVDGRLVETHYAVHRILCITKSSVRRALEDVVTFGKVFIEGELKYHHDKSAMIVPTFLFCVDSAKRAEHLRLRRGNVERGSSSEDMADEFDSDTDGDSATNKYSRRRDFERENLEDEDIEEDEEESRMPRKERVKGGFENIDEEYKPWKIEKPASQ